MHESSQSGRRTGWKPFGYKLFIYQYVTELTLRLGASHFRVGQLSRLTLRFFLTGRISLKDSEKLLGLDSINGCRDLVLCPFHCGKQATRTDTEVHGSFCILHSLRFVDATLQVSHLITAERNRRVEVC
jgi:hypothetical protein